MKTVEHLMLSKGGKRGQWKKTGKVVECCSCGKLIYRNPSTLTKLVFCSRKCSAKGKRPKPKRGKLVACSNCGKEGYRRQSHLSWNQMFCSQSCYTTKLKNNSFFFHCVICSKRVYTQPAQIKYRKRKTCSVLCRGKLARSVAEKRRKENGYTQHQLDRLARYSPEASAWRRAVFERDKYTCQFCGQRGGRLEADHIKPWAYFKELRFELSNGRTLCGKCHDKTKLSSSVMRKIYAKEKIPSSA